MGGVKFAMDRNFEHNLQKMIQPALKELGRDYERMLDSLVRRYKGRPVPQIKPVLRREWRKIGINDVTDPELTEYAECVRDGIKVNFRAK